MLCRAPFSSRTRVHHCRHCGAAVCAACSPAKLPLPKFDLARPVRVCRACHAALVAAPSAAAVAAGPAAAAAAGPRRSAPVAADLGAGARHAEAAAPAATPLLSAAMLLGDARLTPPRPTAADTDTSPEPSSSGEVPPSAPPLACD
jgi:hypothetical protein